MKMDKLTQLTHQDTITRLDLISIYKSKEESSIINWISTILQPPHSLISILIKEIFCPKSTKMIIEKNFHLIRKLLLLNHSDTSKQLTLQKGLSCDIINYIAYTVKSEICQDSLTIMNEIFSGEDCKYYLTEKFVSTIFDLLDVINDEDNFKSAIRILISVNNIFQPFDDNYFLKVYHFHTNSRLFDEVLLRLLNTENIVSKLKEMLDCLIQILECEQKIIFYTSDLEVFIDIALMQLQVTYCEELKYNFIDALHKITGFDDYYKKMYKTEEMMDIIEGYLEHDFQTQRIKRKCKGIIKNINRHLYNKDESEEENQSFNEYETNNSNQEMSFENDEDDQINQLLSIKEVGF